jgi:hypothetical protein
LTSVLDLYHVAPKYYLIPPLDINQILDEKQRTSATDREILAAVNRR